MVGGGGFSMEAPEGMRFLSRARAFTTPELATLDHEPPLRGVDYANGERPPAPAGPVVVAVAQDACPVPGR